MDKENTNDIPDTDVNDAQKRKVPNQDQGVENDNSFPE